MLTVIFLTYQATGEILNKNVNLSCFLVDTLSFTKPHSSFSFREMYSTFIEHLQSIQSLSIFMATPEERLELSCAAAIFGIIEAAIHAAAEVVDQTVPEEHHGMDSLPPLALNWSHVTGFLPLIGGCVTKWVKEILGCDPSPPDLQV